MEVRYLNQGTMAAMSPNSQQLILDIHHHKAKLLTVTKLHSTPNGNNESYFLP